MEKLCFLVLLAVVTTLVSAQTGCKFTQVEIQANVMECLAHEPSLLMQVIEHMSNPQSMLTADFICQNQNAMAELFVCLVNKYASCLKENKDQIMQYMPNKDRWSDALSFMCENRKDLLEQDCIKPDQMQDFMQCYMTKVMGVIQTARATNDIKAAICGVINSEEQCLQTFTPSCSRISIKLILEFLSKIAPYCPQMVIDVNTKGNLSIGTPQLLEIPYLVYTVVFLLYMMSPTYYSWAMNNALGSILMKGQPLKFQPSYNVVNGIQTFDEG